MSDKTSFIQLSRDVDHLSFLKEMPEITEDEHKQFEQVLHDLVSRQASKFDGICHYIKECETRIDLLDKEMKEIKKAKLIKINTKISPSILSDKLFFKIYLNSYLENDSL